MKCSYWTYLLPFYKDITNGAKSQVENPSFSIIIWEKQKCDLESILNEINTTDDVIAEEIAIDDNLEVIQEDYLSTTYTVSGNTFDDIQNTIHSEVKISYDFEHWPSVDDEVRKRITMPWSCRSAHDVDDVDRLSDGTDDVVDGL